MPKDLTPLMKEIGYVFKDEGLLLQALTHSSFANEGHGVESYERLEFLGDSVLGFVTAQYLFEKDRVPDEGELTKLRAAVVCEKALCGYSKQLGLGKYARLGRGEQHSGGAERPSILADMYEAVLAAIYLDGGIEPTRNLIKKLILDREGEKTVKRGDYKTALQELVQRTPGSVITYQLVNESGPDHCRIFEMEVSVGGKPVGRGEGHTKKEAEQQAARMAIETLGK